MKYITLEVKDENEIKGNVKINYNGRFDGIQINAYVIGSNELVEFIEVNGNRISTHTRIYVAKNDITNNEFTFKARVSKYTKIRFRVAIIQEHKEMESEIVFLNR